VHDLQIVPLPGSPARLQGLAGFRGEPLAVLDLRSLLTGVEPLTGTAGTVVVVSAGVGESVGLAVDQAVGVVCRDDEELQGRFHEDGGRGLRMLDICAAVDSVEKLGTADEEDDG